MELYHQTLIRPAQSFESVGLRLLPIKIREEAEKPKQLLLVKSCSLEFYQYSISRNSGLKYQMRLFHREEVFSNICATSLIEFSSNDMKKDFILLALNNGKYQLLEWSIQESKLILSDEGYLFSNENEVENGLRKPISANYIAVNKEAKMVMFAAVNWEFKIYSILFGASGIKLQSELYFQQPRNFPEICLQLSPGDGDSLFHSLRASLQGGIKTTKVYTILKKGFTFQEQHLTIRDNSVHLLVTKGKFYAAIGFSHLYFYSKGKMSQHKLPQLKQALHTCHFRRTNKDRQEFFIINEHGQLSMIIFDENKGDCIVNAVERIFACNNVAVLEKNLFYSISTSEDNYFFQFTGSYKIEDKVRVKATEETTISRQDFLNPKYPQFKEIEIVGVFQSSRMIRDMKLANIQKGLSKQIIITGGRPGNKKGFYSILKYGLKVKQYQAINFPLPTGAWCLKRSIVDRHHSYIVFSFANRKTSIYSFEGVLTHTNQIKLQQFESTLHANKFYDNSIVQVTASKIRHINRDNLTRDYSIKGRIIKATCVSQGKQLFILLIGGFMEYYQLNDNGELKLIKEFNLDSEANHIDFAMPELVGTKPISQAVAIGKNNYKVSVYCLEGKNLELRSEVNAKSIIESITFLPGRNNYQIIVGTSSGKMVKLGVAKHGKIQSFQEEEVGSKAAKFSKLTVLNQPNLLRISPDPTLTYFWQGQKQECTLPLPYVDLITEIAVEGAQKNCIFLTYYENYLRFIEISGFQNLLQQIDKQIELQGRKIVICGGRLGILSESKEKKEDKQIWKSIFCFFNPSKNYMPEKYVQFQKNEKCMCICYVPRDETKGYICFGCVTDYQSYPTMRWQKPIIKVYSYEKQKDPFLNFLYLFAIDDIPTAMEVYFDKLLVGVGKKLILYEIFNSKLMLRAVRGGVTSYINNICVEGEKIITSEVSNSFIVYRLNSIEKSFDYVGEDILPRFLSTTCLLDGDYGVVAGGDKFGTFFVSKFSEKIKSQFETGGQIKYSELTDCSKLDPLVSFHVGEVVTSIQSGQLNERRPQSIFYSTIDGRVGMLYPFESEQVKEAYTLQRLQSELRKAKFPSASSNLLFRSFYTPLKGVIDGDFCNIFSSLSQSQKDRIAKNMEIDVKQINGFLLAMENKFK